MLHYNNNGHIDLPNVCSFRPEIKFKILFQPEKINGGGLSIEWKLIPAHMDTP